MYGPIPVTSDGEGRPRKERRQGPAGGDANDPKQRWIKAYWEEYGRVATTAENRALEAVRDDWRPICSFSTNLVRIGALLLEADSAWVLVGQAREKARRAIERPQQILSALLGRPTPAWVALPGIAVTADNVVECFQTVWRMPAPRQVLRRLSLVGAAPPRN